MGPSDKCYCRNYLKKYVNWLYMIVVTSVLRGVRQGFLLLIYSFTFIFYKFMVKFKLGTFKIFKTIWGKIIWNSHHPTRSTVYSKVRHESNIIVQIVQATNHSYLLANDLGLLPHPFQYGVLFISPYFKMSNHIKSYTIRDHM